MTIRQIFVYLNLFVVFISHSCTSKKIKHESNIGDNANDLSSKDSLVHSSDFHSFIGMPMEFDSCLWMIEKSDSQSFKRFSAEKITGDTQNLPKNLLYKGKNYLWPWDSTGPSYQKSDAWYMNHKYLVISYFCPSHTNYFIYQPVINVMDTVRGSPIFYKDRMLSIMDPNTDHPHELDLWKFELGRWHCLWSIDLRIFNIYLIDAAYIDDQTIVLKTNNIDYIKLKLLSDFRFNKYVKFHNYQ